MLTQSYWKVNYNFKNLLSCTCIGNYIPVFFHGFMVYKAFPYIPFDINSSFEARSVGVIVSVLLTRKLRVRELK